MTEIEFIPNDARITHIEYHPQFSTTCSIGKAPFFGMLDISYNPQADLLEFESFEAWLFDRALESYTIEGFTRFVYDTLSPRLNNLVVTCQALTTKHGKVECTISYGGITK